MLFSVLLISALALSRSSASSIYIRVVDELSFIFSLILFLRVCICQSARYEFGYCVCVFKCLCLHYIWLDGNGTIPLGMIMLMLRRFFSISVERERRMKKNILISPANSTVVEVRERETGVCVSLHPFVRVLRLLPLSLSLPAHRHILSD